MTIQTIGQDCKVLTEIAPPRVFPESQTAGTILGCRGFGTNLAKTENLTALAQVGLSAAMPDCPYWPLLCAGYFPGGHGTCTPKWPKCCDKNVVIKML